MQKNMSEDRYISILDPSLFKVISLHDIQMQVSIVILTNKFGVSTFQIPSITLVKLEPNDDGVLYCQIMMRSLSSVDLKVTLPCPFRSTTSTLSKLLVTTTLIILYTCPPLHPLPCFSCLNIVKACIKSGIYTSVLATFLLKNIEVHDILTIELW